jgi:hypothetical protein
VGNKGFVVVVVVVVVCCFGLQFRVTVHHPRTVKAVIQAASHVTSILSIQERAAKDQLRLVEEILRGGVFESSQKSDSKSSCGLQAEGLCSAQDSFPDISLSLSLSLSLLSPLSSLLSLSPALSLAIPKTLWITHLLQTKSPVFNFYINTVTTPGSLSIIP